MKVKVAFDISKARLVHLEWLFQIEKALEQGPDVAPCALQDYHNCELGLWLHGEGRSKYRQYEDIRRLTIEHRQFHQTVDGLLIALYDRDTKKVQELLISVRHMSKDIIYLLTILELRTIEKLRIRQLGGGLLSFVESLFPSKSNWLEAPKTKDSTPTLDITYARLAHLRWASTLDHSFRNFGHGVALQAHDSCEFGTWIARVGLKRYSDIHEMRLLEAVHKNFHEAASRIIRCLHGLQPHKADEAYADVQNLSREIAWLLTIVEYRLPACRISDEFPAPKPQSPELPSQLQAVQHVAVPAPVTQLSPIMAVAEHLVGR